MTTITLTDDQLEALCWLADGQVPNWVNTPKEAFYLRLAEKLAKAKSV